MPTTSNSSTNVEVTADGVPSSSASSAYNTMKSLLGKTIRCTLDDGRTAEGEFICLDRM